MDSPGFSLCEEEVARYNRHIIIPGFGLPAQQKLKNAKVLVIGAGGLGSPVLLYLAAAGVGTLGIVDFDVVENSNLQRQVLFGINGIGQPKVLAARQRLLNLNPFIKIEVYYTTITSANAMELISGYDVVADGTDNFTTRYLINDACVLSGKPNVYASIFQFEGQLTVFNHLNLNGQRGPNYRDLFSTPPPKDLVPNCAEGGVLGVLPGVIGTLQALEVIKVITGLGEVLSGRLYCFDALHFESRIFELKANPANPISGVHPSIHELIDYEQFCSMPSFERPVKEVTAREFYNWQIKGEDYQLIDVREPDEYERVNLDGELIPLATIVENAERISRLKKVVIHCKVGGRSEKAIRQLEDHFGFQNLYNLKGGIVAYSKEVQPPIANF
jgi:adenylyltransferase/sulfurtransferase